MVKKRSPPSPGLRRAEVELRGIEPRSRQGDHMLSSCLALLGFRDRSGAEQPNMPLVPVGFTFRPEQPSG